MMLQILKINILNKYTKLNYYTIINVANKENCNIIINAYR